MASLQNSITNGNTTPQQRAIERNRQRQRYGSIPDPDESTIAGAVNSIAQAASRHFRQCFAVRPHDNYDEAFGRFESMVRVAVGEAIRAEYFRCNELAQRIADDAVRHSFSAEGES